jgi:hypothetical protein
VADWTKTRACKFTSAAIRKRLSLSLSFALFPLRFADDPARPYNTGNVFLVAAFAAASSLQTYFLPPPAAAAATIQKRSRRVFLPSLVGSVLPSFQRRK